ncbi:ATP-binding cassette domain-containing protein [Gammaproteobacteria bacterium AB-CW1]|uniref:ATP-binding cassette domain-containing protein n=1 Tax=Natronospira elongata TaxID=3110268 RepID=A0AAP6JFX2_9GAMM|nr:ATP-binding cassette domain-containing protein [Gammaproteobacteria bacterium AB-CW1]
MDAVSLNDLRCWQGNRPLFAIPHWALPQGEYGLMSGPSGCGKTSLLHCIAGLDSQFSGQLSVNGTALSELGQRGRDRLRGEHIGLIFQDFHLLEGLTVEDNLRLGSWLGGRGQSRAHAMDWLDRLGLSDQARHYPNQLSQGQKQRVAIGRALIHAPKLILADEPTSALDDRNAESVLALLFSEAAGQGASLLVASHDNRIRDQFSHRLALDAYLAEPANRSGQT